MVGSRNAALEAESKQDDNNNDDDDNNKDDDDNNGDDDDNNSNDNAMSKNGGDKKWHTIVVIKINIVGFVWVNSNPLLVPCYIHI